MSARALAAVLGLLFLIVSMGGAHAAVEVRVEGVDEEAERNIRAFLQIVRLSADDDVRADRVRRAHRRAPEQIREALEPLGYYRPQVDSELKREEDRWLATYTVDPGDLLRFTEIDVRLTGEGVDDGAFRQAVDNLAIGEGDRVHHGRYEQAKRDLQSLAVRRGYFDARWEMRRLLVDPAAGRAEVALHMDTGPRYRYGAIAFEQDILDDDFLRRYLRFAEGDPYDRRDLLDLQFMLGDSDYFDAVDVVADRDGADTKRVPVRVQTEPRARDRYTWGIGWGTDTGARTRVGWERRRVNRQGHGFEVEGELAEVRRRFGVAYTIPLGRPDRERLILDARFRREEFGDGLSRTNEVGARRVRSYSRWQLTEGVLFERSRDTLGDFRETRQIIVPHLGLEQRQRDDAVYPSRAYRFNIDLRGSTRELASDVNFAQIRIGASWVRKILPRTRILTRGEWGASAVGEVGRLPLSQRFFTGGDATVRGFSYQSLGPRNEDGDVIGGRYLTTASIELERLVVGNWGAAIFTDAGNVANERRMSLEQSAGVGARWRSPVGMLRVDVAQSLTTDDSPRLHLSLGVDL